MPKDEALFTPEYLRYFGLALSKRYSYVLKTAPDYMQSIIDPGSTVDYKKKQPFALITSS